MSAILMTVSDVRSHGDNLSIITVSAGHEVVANRHPDGSFRWTEGEPVIYVPENMLIPEDVLRERGYWDENRNKGLLEGKKGNRVKMRRFAGFESRGLLFKVGLPGQDWSDDRNPDKPYWVLRESVTPDTIDAGIGDDVGEFLGIVEHSA